MGRAIHREDTKKTNRRIDTSCVPSCSSWLRGETRYVLNLYPGRQTEDLVLDEEL